MKPTTATWTSADGTVRRIVDMTDEHLENTIKWLKRHEYEGSYSNRPHRRARLLLRKLPILRQERERRANLPYLLTPEDLLHIEYLNSLCRMIELSDELFGLPPLRVGFEDVVSMTGEEVIRAMNSGLRIHIGAKVRQSLLPRRTYPQCPRPFRYS